MAMQDAVVREGEDEIDAGSTQSCGYLYPMIGGTLHHVQSLLRESLGVGEIGFQSCAKVFHEGLVREQGSILRDHNSGTVLNQVTDNQGECVSALFRHGTDAAEADTEIGDARGLAISGGVSGRLLGEPVMHALGDGFDTAIELDAGPAKLTEVRTSRTEILAHGVVVRFLAAVF